MAIKQYIGARYVPKFEGVFDSTKSYEPLSIVEDGNGNSYTSKIPVPVGSSLTDTQYWIKTSSMSGDVRQLEARMQTAEENIDSLGVRETAAEENIDSLGVRVTAAEENIDSLGVRVTTLENSANKSRKFLFLSDSYGMETNINNKTYVNIYSENTGITCEHITQGGAGWGQNAPYRYLTPLQNYSGDRTAITDLIIVGGANDDTSDYASILAGMQTFDDYLKANYPNVTRKIIFPVGLHFDNRATPAQRDSVFKNYKAAGSTMNYIVVDNAQYILRNSELLRDLLHPNSNGVNEIGNQLIQSIGLYFVKPCDVIYELQASLTSTGEKDTQTLSQNLRMRRHNNNVEINVAPSSGAGYQFNFTAPHATNIGVFKVVTLNKSLCCMGETINEGVDMNCSFLSSPSGEWHYGWGKILIDTSGVYVVTPMNFTDCIRVSFNGMIATLN